MRNAQQQGVIVWAVANVDQTNTLRSMRCGSGMFFCLAAPGTNINSTVPGGGYASLTGTSMASPHVSGAVAIVRQMFPEASTEELASIVLQTATDLGASGIEPEFGWGLLIGNLSATLDAETAALYSAASWGKLSTMRAVSDALRARWLGDAAAGDASLVSAYAPTSRSDDPFEALEPERRDVWISAFGDLASLEAGPAAPAYENRAGGMLAGLTFHETESLRLGGAIGLSNSHLESRGGADSASATGLHAALLADWESGDWFARSTAQLAYFHHDYLRTTISGTGGVSVAPTGTASAGSFGAGLDLKFGRSLASGASVFEPYAALAGRSNSSGSFSEAGSGAFALSVDGQSVSQLDLGGGIRWRWEDPKPEGTQLGLMFDLAYFRLAGDNAHSVEATLMGTPISASTAEVGRDIIRIGAEFRLTDTDLNWSASARYGGSLQRGAQSHSLSAQFSAKF